MQWSPSKKYILFLLKMRKQVKHQLIKHVLYDTHRAGFMNLFRNK